MILASASDLVQFGFGLVVAIIIPLIGLILSLAALKHKGLNSKCGFSTVFLFIAMFLSAGAMTLQQSGGITSRPAYFAYASAAAIHVFSGLLGVFGVREMRRRKKWQRGARRAISSVVTNIVMLCLIATYFYLRLNPQILDRFLEGA